MSQRDNELRDLLIRYKRFLLHGAGDTTAEAVEGNHLAELGAKVIEESLELRGLLREAIGFREESLELRGLLREAIGFREESSTKKRLYGFDWIRHVKQVLGIAWDE